MVCSICKASGHNRRTCPSKVAEVDESPAIPAAPVGLRGALPDHSSIWEYRDDSDAYSQFTRLSIADHNPEKDHVFEIQLLDVAFFKYDSTVGAQMVTRGEKSRIQALANCVENTNVTTREINRSKKGPFTCAKNALVANDFDSQYCPGVDSYFYTKSGSRRANKYNGMTSTNWERIKSEVVASFDSIENQVTSAVHTERNAELFSDCLREVFLSLRIED